MRKLIWYLAVWLILLGSTGVHAALTYDGDYYLAHMNGQYTFSRTGNPIYLSLVEIEEDMAAIVAGAGDLDAQYNGGSAIDVDTDAVTLTVSDTDNNSALIINMNDSTNDPTALSIVMGAGHTGTALTINSQAGGTDITADNWSITQAGLLTGVGFTCTGEIQTNADVLFNGTYDVAWDVNRNQLIIEDNAVLGFGGAHDAAADVTITWDTTNLLIEAAAQDTGIIKIGATNSMDFNIYGNTATDIASFDSGAGALLLDSYPISLGDGDAILFGDALGTGDFSISDQSDVLTIDVVAAGVGEIAIGNDADDVPMKWYGEDSGAYFYFTGNQLQGIGGAQITLNDSVELLLGTGAAGAGDFAITGTSAPVLSFTQVVADTGEITYGADGTDIPSKWFAETAGDYFQITGDDVVLEDVSLCIADGTQIQFGDAVGTGQMYMSIATAALTIGQVAAGTGTLLIGANDKGIDTTYYGETAGDYMMWDQDGASNLGALIFEDSVLQFAGANVTYSTAISTDALAITATDHANANITIGAAGGTHSVDLTLYGFTASNTVVFDGGSETLTLTDVDLNISVPDATDIGMTVTAGGANTASMVVVDGATGAAAWVGAATTGMLHLTCDGALVADGSLLRIASSGNISAANDGALLELVESGAAQATSYAMRIASTSNEALHVDSGVVLIDETLTATLGVQVGVGETLTANSDSGAGSTVDSGITVANVTAVNAGANDWIELPNDPAIGTVVKVLCNAGSNFEIRTLEAGNDKINNVDCSDGGTEYLATDTDMIIFTCVKADYWSAVSYPLAGGVRAAVTPD